MIDKTFDPDMIAVSKILSNLADEIAQDGEPPRSTQVVTVNHRSSLQLSLQVDLVFPCGRLLQMISSLIVTCLYNYHHQVMVVWTSWF